MPIFEFNERRGLAVAISTVLSVGLVAAGVRTHDQAESSNQHRMALEGAAIAGAPRLPSSMLAGRLCLDAATMSATLYCPDKPLAEVPPPIPEAAISEPPPENVLTTEPPTPDTTVPTPKATSTPSAQAAPAAIEAPGAHGVSLGTFEATCYAQGETTATGTPVGIGTIAVDPNVIPLGTNLYIEGYGPGTALDTGGAIKGRILDVYKPSEADCLNWGRHPVEVWLN